MNATNPNPSWQMGGDTIWDPKDNSLTKNLNAQIIDATFPYLFGRGNNKGSKLHQPNLI